MSTTTIVAQEHKLHNYWTECEFQLRKLTAALKFRRYRAEGGDLPAIDWLWENDRELFAAIQSRWRFQSSYTAITGGVMFHPEPPKSRKRP